MITTLLILVNQLKNLINIYINIDLKNLTNWLNTNKISINVIKTELVIFKYKKKKLGCPMKIKLNRKRL